MANAVRRERSGAGNPHVYLMLCAALVLTAHASLGGTQSIMGWTDVNRNAYSNNGQWSGGVAPVADSSGTYDYLIAYGFYLWIPESSANMTFGGASVQVGSHDPTYADATGNTAGSIYYKGDCRWLTFPDLRMYCGGIGSGANNWFGLAGNATVYSTEEKPFTFTLGTARNTDTYLDLTFTGDEGTVFVIDQVGTGWIYTYADQSQTYSGSWKIGKNVMFRPTYDANRGKILNSTMAFGKPLSVFNPKSVTVGAGATLRVETYNRIFSASDNRGLWLDAAGDQVEYLMINDNAHFFGWPIAGEGTFRLFGNGAFYLQSSCDVPVRVGSGASLVLDICSDLKQGVTVEEGGTLYIRQVLTNGVPSDQPARLSTALDTSLRPIGVCLSAYATVTAETDIPVAVIDKAVAASYTEADFDPWGVVGGQIPNAKGIVFSTDANGDTVVSVRVFPYVVSVTQNAGIVNLNDANGWSPNGVVTDGKNYIVWNNQLRTGTDGKDPCSMPGDLLVFYKAGNYGCKDYTTSFRKARLLDDAAFGLGLAHPSYRARFSGHIDVRTTKGGTASISSNGQKIRMEQNATLTGRGNLVMKGTARDPSVTTSDYAVEMTGDASGYVGTLFAQNLSSSPSAPMILKAAGETNFGGNPERFAADALKIGAMVALTPTAAMMIDDANRGVTFEATASVDTTSGDCTIKTPVVFAGAFTKSGAGTFAFGAGGVTFGTGASIAVNGGVLKPEGVNALKGAAVSFADGAVLTVDADSDPLDLTTTTFSKTGDKFAVCVDGLVQDTPIATFASAQAAADFVANAKTVKGTTGRKGQLVADGATVKAILPGLAIIFR